jgi:CelD/BcsL family acetyltransferase involved in cellulose biosynthesis
VEGGERFAGLGEQWDQLAGPEALPFDRHCWYESWRRAFAPGARLATCTAWRGDELVGALPMWLRRGDRLEAMANVHTPAFRPLAADEGTLAALLGAAFRAPTRSVTLLPLRIDDPSLQAVERAATECGRRWLRERQQLSPVIDTQGTFDDWVRETKPRWHTQIPRYRRKMARDHTLEIALATEPDDLEAELDQGFHVEASGWKGRQGTAILSSPETAAFYRNVAEAFHARGELRLSSILLDGEAAAFDFCLLSGRRLYLLKTGYDERFRTYAPGLVLRLATVEHCFQEGLEAHELAGDDAPWKRKFSTSDWQYCAVRAYARSPGGNGLHAYRRWARPALARAYGLTRDPLRRIARRSSSMASPAEVASRPARPLPTATVSSPGSPVAKRFL